METPLLPDDATVEGNVDFKGRPAKRSHSGRWFSAAFIMVVEMAERSAYFGISSNLMSYLTGPLGQSTSTAAVNINVWSGTALLLPLLGAFVADSFLGRFRTIILAFLLYILGLGLLAFSAVIPSMLGYSLQFQIMVFFLSLYVVAVAQGMHKPCVQAFGADQFDELDEAESLAKSSFFNWCSVSISLAIIVSLVTLTCVQEYLSWGLGFGIPCFIMCLGLVCFLLGTTTYRFRVSSCQDNKAFSRIGRVFVKAARNWRASSCSLSEEDESSGFRQYMFLNKAMIGKEDENECSSTSEVEEAKALLRLFPIWISCLVYGVLYSQPATLFTKQGLTMNRSISSGFEVPSATLQCLINVTMIAFIPIYDCILVPFTRSFTRKPSGISMLQRIGIGLFLSVLSMSVAALVERKRLDVAMDHGLVEQPNSAVPMSVFWLIPQYLLFGLSESFAFVGMQEFFYDQVPDELKSSGVSLYLSVLGMGGFLSSILISSLEKFTGGYGEDDCDWFCDNLNKAHLDYFYWLLAGLSAMTLAIFVYFAKGYVYRRKLLEIKSQYEA